MDKLIKKVDKDLNKAKKDNKVLLKADQKQDKKVDKLEKKGKR